MNWEDSRRHVVAAWRATLRRGRASLPNARAERCMAGCDRRPRRVVGDVRHGGAASASDYCRHQSGAGAVARASHPCWYGGTNTTSGRLRYDCGTVQMHPSAVRPALPGCPGWLRTVLCRPWCGCVPDLTTGGQPHYRARKRPMRRRSADLVSSPVGIGRQLPHWLSERFSPACWRVINQFLLSVNPVTALLQSLDEYTIRVFGRAQICGSTGVIGCAVVLPSWSRIDVCRESMKPAGSERRGSDGLDARIASGK